MTIYACRFCDAATEVAQHSVCMHYFSSYEPIRSEIKSNLRSESNENNFQNGFNNFMDNMVLVFKAIDEILYYFIFYNLMKQFVMEKWYRLFLIYIVFGPLFGLMIIFFYFFLWNIRAVA